MRVFVVTSLAVFQAVLVQCSFRSSHDFPILTHRGEQAANEFQMIHPENVRFANTNAGAFSIKSVEPLIINNGDLVTVSFSADSPTSLDWIGAYSPASTEILSTVPVKYGFCSDDQNYLASGSGQLTFNFTNLRADIGFFYFTNGTQYPINVGKFSNVVTFKNFNQPLRPRIVATGDQNVLKLLWSSATSARPVMKWGVKPGVYTNTVRAKTSSLSKDEMCGAPASTIGWRDLGLIHTAELRGMLDLANQNVYYIFGDESTHDFSEENVLHLPPLVGTNPPNRPTTVVLFDDLGRGSLDHSYTWNEYGRPSINTTMSIAEHVRRGEIDALYHGGDISYATGYMAVWDFFLDMLSPVASGTVYLTTVGNHESAWLNSKSYYNITDSGGECGVPATRLLPMPSPATTDEPWWSYDVGLIHFIGISTEHNYTVGSKQHAWLERDLKSVDRTVTPWIIFGAHRAMYINSNYSGAATSDVTVMDLMVANLEPLLFKYRVNFGFYGHNHVVQRHSAIYNYDVVQASVEKVDKNGNVVHFQEDPQATVHWIIGTGGAGFTKTAYEPKPAWNENYFYQWGYAIAKAENASYLSLDWIDSSTNEVVDRTVITQSDPTKPWKH